MLLANTRRPLQTIVPSRAFYDVRIGFHRPLTGTVQEKPRGLQTNATSAAQRRTAPHRLVRVFLSVNKSVVGPRGRHCAAEVVIPTTGSCRRWSELFDFRKSHPNSLMASPSLYPNERSANPEMSQTVSLHEAYRRMSVNLLITPTADPR